MTLKFYKDLEKEIKRKYKNNSNIKRWSGGDKFGLNFGLKGVYNNYRISKPETDPKLRIDITIHDKEENEDFYYFLKNKITDMEDEVGEKLELKDNSKYHLISYYYPFDIINNDNDTERKLALCELSSNAIILMESVLKLHKEFIASIYYKKN
nr:DUF4268 domain-containing protein [Methanobrevibacter arboriphilus]